MMNYRPPLCYQPLFLYGALTNTAEISITDYVLDDA